MHWVANWAPDSWVPGPSCFATSWFRPHFPFPSSPCKKEGSKWCDQSDNQTWMSPSVNPSVSVLAIDNSNPNSFSDQLFSMSECANPGGDASLLWSSLHHPDLLLDPLCCYCESSNLCQIFHIHVQMSILSCTFASSDLSNLQSNLHLIS